MGEIAPISFLITTVSMIIFTDGYILLKTDFRVKKQTPEKNVLVLVNPFCAPLERVLD